MALDKDIDIDWESYLIYVNNTLTKDENDNVILGDRTKTYSGQRTLKMDAMVIYILKQAFEEYISNKYNLLFCTENAELINEGASNSAFKRFCQKYEISKKREINQHMLRHSFATRKIEGGMPAEILMVIMGHKDVSVTLNTYFDAFAQYKNVYDEKTYNYYEMNGLTFEIIDKSYIIKQELKYMLERINNSHLEENEKQKLLSVVNGINNQYMPATQSKQKTITNNVILFPTMVSQN